MKLIKFILICLISCITSQAIAHPHSFIDLKNEVLLEGTTLKGFQMEWTMDEIASAELIYEVKSSSDREATKKSITAEMVQTVIENHYFSYLYNAKNEPLKFTTKPSDTTFRIADKRVVFYVTFYLSQPYDLTNNPVRFYTYEPSYYMAMEYNNKQDLSISNQECKVSLEQPQVNQSLRLYASSLDKTQTPDMPDEDGNSLGAQFAQKVVAVCE
ncbi:DUF1007 family protein [Actinobacillus arthritidis]|uniref:DUF1007 family protein n=1 Tax=Actinobacillus arthritidis TaxID=157339 RepID=UPI002442CE01|nr:DUF1007 family protein [Actinobacillus arthritidis]WGE90059.1 DUF1007 family protein [Actinobacillus arthritidis]